MLKYRARMRILTKCFTSFPIMCNFNSKIIIFQNVKVSSKNANTNEMFYKFSYYVQFQ